MGQQARSSIQGTQITVESLFVSRFTMNNIAPKLQKCWRYKISFKIISKMLKQPNFFYFQPFTLPKNAPANFYLSTTFSLSFMTSSVAPTRSSTFYTYLITKIRNRNLNLYTNFLPAFGSKLPYLEKCSEATVLPWSGTNLLF